MDTVYTALVFPLLLLIGQTLVALGQRKLNQRMDEGEARRNDAKADTDAKRAAEAQWRADTDQRMADFEQALASQNRSIGLVLRGQITQMRSDIIHKAHRYLDDLGCASTEEKDAFNAEYEEYRMLCETADVDNDFVDTLHQQVMELPGRDTSARRSPTGS